jgi:hypothetical protein
LSNHARNGLWTVFHTAIYKANIFREPVLGGRLTDPLATFLKGVWVHYYKRPIDEYPEHHLVITALKQAFLGAVRHFPFDILEAIFENDAHSNYSGKIMRYPERVATWINEVLKQENQAHTFVDGRFVERMTTEEIASVETALKTPIEAIRAHFETALRYLSELNNPVYRNSVKESISAVEAACRHLTGQKSATLGDALKKLDNQRSLHAAFKEGLLKLYGFTCDQGGIRHALTDDATSVQYADAQFMLVACSAFVNYLLTR